MQEDLAKKVPDIMRAKYLKPSIEEGASTTMVAALDPALTCMTIISIDAESFY